MDWDYTKSWFHGSPHRFKELEAGSTITQDRALAVTFSHKPSLVVTDENGSRFHNGKYDGYLYVIDEVLTAQDVYPHPDTTMKPGEEWLIRRPLQVKEIGQTTPNPAELLTVEEEQELLMKLRNRQARSLL